MYKRRKGIILAGGKGSRLAPITNVISKQLLHIYDKPMIYYPLSTLMIANIKDILIITNPKDLDLFKCLLGDGKDLGINLQYEIQENPNGLAEAFLIGEQFIAESNVALILGDNLFHGDSLRNAMQDEEDFLGAKIFGYQVKDPCRYGVIEFDTKNNVISIEEKPKEAKSNFAVTGLYFYDDTVVERSKSIKPSKRGELEITDLNLLYLKDKQLKVELLNRGTTWLDTGTFDSLHEASSYIYTIERRQGLKIGCPEEVAWRNGWIKDEQLEKLSTFAGKNDYVNYLKYILERK